MLCSDCDLWWTWFVGKRRASRGEDEDNSKERFDSQVGFGQVEPDNSTVYIQNPVVALTHTLEAYTKSAIGSYPSRQQCTNLSLFILQ